MTHDTLDPTLAQTLSSDEEASQEGVERPLSSTSFLKPGRESGRASLLPDGARVVER